ncbi:hypothetical protein LC048_08000 [Mesobacillus subterraneus]|uniref:hypothetical protein n=1 Tax=Mesobacillus subterraneus TaxID=285983 RepID=UPI00273DD505|nr:hypothetical protein [Mesobacillus subterraneus]WLR56803.1 hypothetical protein LC048_08000 [Mesobacillus subterraneus]
MIENGKINRKEYGMKEYNNRTSSPVPDSKEKEDQLMVIQNEINAIIGRLSFMDKGEPGYEQLDKNLSELMKKKRNLS